MILALLAAAVLAAGVPRFGAAPRPPAPAAAPAAAPVLAPAEVLARYATALASLREPRVFAFEYTLEQTGPRTLDQTHRVFRSGNDERDETLAVNGTRSLAPVVRVFRGRPYRYTVRALAPRPSAYDFTYAGPHRDGKHVDYVYRLVPKSGAHAIAFTSVTIDGITFLPHSVTFTAPGRGAGGSVTFGKADRFWVARAADAQAKGRAGVAHERLSFTNWRFPKSLPASTFAMPRPLPTLPAPPAG
ncbi:MAG TPA: hypothetical protein VHT53_09785 [Candidatus Elarobacter sp.]|jgi:hypothetical protein|nr:hypothetical protein [Candidatus Elarobacter sp.]